MDYARKIGKQKNDRWPKLRDCVPQKPCNPRKPVTPLQEDRRLANWKRWLADRERRQKYLAAALKREPIDLVLNAHEKVRTKNETKCLLEAADRTEVTNQDKYRGNPAFWKSEQRLKKKCVHNEEDDDDDTDDDVIIKKGRDDKFLPPDITRVALPAYIKKEKMLIEACADSSKINLHSKWNCGEYLKHRRAQLKREIKYLEPKQPETENLIIIGRSEDCQKKADFIRIPVITITPDESKRKLLNDPDDRAALSIQGREFVLESARHFEKLSANETQRLRETDEDLNGKKYVYAPFDCERVYEVLSKKCKAVEWTLHFLANDAEITERKFCMENRGVRVVHIEWRREAPTISQVEFPERLDSRFFFNKSRVSILPGQKVEMPVWFHSNRPVVATETWKLVVDPKVYPGPLLLRLWAVSNADKDKLKREQQYKSVKASLSDCVRDVKIREIIDDLIVIATTELCNDDEPYELYFLESQLFEARNPGYYYKSLLVNELKRMHEDVTSERNWNLLLGGLKSNLVKLENPIERREKLVRFQAICQECLLPDFYYTRPRASKHKLVYLLLCMFFNRFEDEDDYVMLCCCREIVADDACEEAAAAVSLLSEMEDGQSEVFDSGRNRTVYREAMFIRIYCLLRETIDKICVAVESCDFFNK